MALELQTQWVDNVFDEADSVPHFNYQTLGSSNLEVFMEEDQDNDEGMAEGIRGPACDVSSPPPPATDICSNSRIGSTGSASSIGMKYNGAPRKLCIAT